MSTIITITGYKGGVGKSTTAFHLAAFLGDRFKTVLVDGDPNRTALSWSTRGKEKNVANSLSFVVADERQAMKYIGGAEFVIIDTPARPHSDDLFELAKGCDLLILPTRPDVVSLEPMLEIASDLGEACFRALITMSPPYPSQEAKQMQQDLSEGGVPVFKTLIRQTTGFGKAALEGVPIGLIKDRSKVAAQDYLRLGKEVLEALNG